MPGPPACPPMVPSSSSLDGQQRQPTYRLSGEQTCLPNDLRNHSARQPAGLGPRRSRRGSKLLVDQRINVVPVVVWAGLAPVLQHTSAGVAPVDQQDVHDDAAGARVSVSGTGAGRAGTEAGIATGAGVAGAITVRVSVSIRMIRIACINSAAPASGTTPRRTSSEAPSFGLVMPTQPTGSVPETAMRYRTPLSMPPVIQSGRQ